MSLSEPRDYVYIPKVHVNEGFSSGTVTVATFVGTRNYLFIFPWMSHTAKGTRIDMRTGVGLKSTAYSYGPEKAPNPLAILEALFKDSKLTLPTLEKQCIDFLTQGPQYVHPLSDLEKFNVKTGWLTGGMFFKRYNGPRQTMNLPKKINKLKVALFYKDLLKL